LVNITGGNDLTLFEVDEVVNKIRAEVDSEAELISGSIEDENLNGKIRVSIVATALDGQVPEMKSVINMVHRIQNRNTGYSEFINGSTPAETYQTEGANALKLQPEIKIEESAQSENLNETTDLDIPIENVGYLENTENNQESKKNELIKNEPISSRDEDDTLKLFSEDENIDGFIDNTDDFQSSESNTFLHEEDNNEEENYEIPAFLRKQKN